jgi:hypothetical protein
MLGLPSQTIIPKMPSPNISTRAANITFSSLMRMEDAVFGERMVSSSPFIAGIWPNTGRGTLWTSQMSIYSGFHSFICWYYGRACLFIGPKAIAYILTAFTNISLVDHSIRWTLNQRLQDVTGSRGRQFKVPEKKRTMADVNCSKTWKVRELVQHRSAGGWNLPITHRRHFLKFPGGRKRHPYLICIQQLIL